MARISGIDLPRDKRIEVALTYIYGIGPARAAKVLEVTGIDPDIRVKDLTDEQEKANKYAHEIVPMMERLRAGVDAMEIVVAHDLWPVPTYNDILFYV